MYVRAVDFDTLRPLRGPSSRAQIKNKPKVNVDPTEALIQARKRASFGVEPAAAWVLGRKRVKDFADTRRARPQARTNLQADRRLDRIRTRSLGLDRAAALLPKRRNAGGRPGTAVMMRRDAAPPRNFRTIARARLCRSSAPCLVRMMQRIRLFLRKSDAFSLERVGGRRNAGRSVRAAALPARWAAKVEIWIQRRGDDRWVCTRLTAAGAGAQGRERAAQSAGARWGRRVRCGLANACWACLRQARPRKASTLSGACLAENLRPSSS